MNQKQLYKQKWYQENKQRLKQKRYETLKKWRQENPAKLRLQRQKYWINNFEKLTRKRAEDNKKRIKYKGKTTWIGKIIRTGMCSNCYRSVEKGEINQTQMHHLKYDDNHIEQYTIELCVRCHRKIHSKGG